MQMSLGSAQSGLVMLTLIFMLEEEHKKHRGEEAQWFILVILIILHDAISFAKNIRTLPIKL